MILAVLLSVVLNSAPLVPHSFVPPQGWTEGKDLPPDGPDAIWLSPGFGKNGNGENLAVTSRPAGRQADLPSEVRAAIAELSADRDITVSRAESTCRGKLPGWRLEAKLSFPNGLTISQVYHLSLVGGRTYTFVFTHKASDAIEPAISDAIQSICA
ncbi:MAG TPA: hypothetical protein VFL13_12835 [Candidatus Baltobacteraceae bacterium]|nr:hypothetical protein [Candidatus Baltobacteraceae bacterium]